MHLNLSFKLVLMAFAALSLLEARIAAADIATTSTADVSTKSLPFLMRVLDGVFLKVSWMFVTRPHCLAVYVVALMGSPKCMSSATLLYSFERESLGGSVLQLLAYHSVAHLQSLSLLRLFYVNREVRKYPISPQFLAGGAGDSPN